MAVVDTVNLTNHMMIYNILGADLVTVSEDALILIPSAWNGMGQDASQANHQ